MSKSILPLPQMSPLSTRLSGLYPLAETARVALQTAEIDCRCSPARREIVAVGEPIREQRALLSGWACRQRILADGRRQILGFLLPGDLIGVCRQTNPIAATTMLAVTELVTCPLPPADESSGLGEAYARSAALEEHYFLAHITRLGRLNAQERLADWLLETQERLALSGLATADRFPLPLTQEMLADALGLTSVHVNRTLRGMRREGLISLSSGVISIPDRGRLERLVDYRPARVTSDG